MKEIYETDTYKLMVDDDKYVWKIMIDDDGNELSEELVDGLCGCRSCIDNTDLKRV